MDAFFCISRLFSTILPSLPPIPPSSFFFRSMCQYPIGSTLFLAFYLRAFALIASAFSFWIHPHPRGAGCTKRRERTGFATLQRKLYIYQSKGVTLSTVVYTTIFSPRFTPSRLLLVFLYRFVKRRRSDDTVFTHSNPPFCHRPYIFG